MSLETVWLQSNDAMPVVPLVTAAVVDEGFVCTVVVLYTTVSFGRLSRY